MTSFGIWVIIKSRKLKAKLLKYMGIVIILLGLPYLGVCTDFITVLFTGHNMDKALFIILGYVWAGGALYFSVIIYCELTMPEKKKYILPIYFFLAFIYTIYVIVDPMNSFVITYPGEPGEELMQAPFNWNSPLIIIGIIGITSFIIFCCFGYLYEALQSTGIIRKKFFYLFLGYSVWISGAILEAFLFVGIFIVFVRIIALFSAIFFYFGIREEPEKKERIKPKKEVKVKGDLFRISKRPDQITEEEVSISKEKKICLVCKGRVRHFNVYICDCDTFYCAKCARALIVLENMCWACSGPIDKSKPIKPYKREEEEIEISEKPQKKPKVNKKS